MPNDRGLIFRSSTGNQIHTQTFHKPWKAFLEWAGFGGQAAGQSLRFHSLRHFHASYLQFRGMAPADVARQLGHAKYDTTLGTYSHSVLSPAHQLDQARLIMAHVTEAA
jgi:integrase